MRLDTRPHLERPGHVFDETTQRSKVCIKSEVTDAADNELLQQAIQKQERLAESRLEMAKLFLQKGKPKIAVRRLKEFVNDFGEADVATEAKALLKKLRLWCPWPIWLVVFPSLERAACDDSFAGRVSSDRFHQSVTTRRPILAAGGDLCVRSASPAMLHFWLILNLGHCRRRIQRRPLRSNSGSPVRVSRTQSPKK